MKIGRQETADRRLQTKKLRKYQFLEVLLKYVEIDSRSSQNKEPKLNPNNN